MRYLYYCNSTYQLLNILNLHWHRKNAGFEDIRDYEGDLMVQGSFEGAEKIAEILIDNKIFSKVFLVNKTFNSGRFHSLQTLIDLLFPSLCLKNKYGMNVGEIRKKYDVLCVPKYSNLLDQIWRLNPAAKLHLHEDGIGSYHLSLMFGSRSKRYERIRRFVSKSRFEDYERLYLVNKEMYIGANEDRVYEFPKLDEDDIERLRNLFSSFASGYAEKNIYWLSQFLNNREFNEMMAEVLKCLVSYKDDVLFCQHPRTHMENIHGFEETDGRQIWELQILNMKELEQKLFISIHSTACFTAKMLYDKEPYVIMFYRMGDPEVTYVTEEFEECVRRFISSYRDPDKVMLPENLDEVRECIHKYLTAVKESKQNKM